jgi:hypothetical protein
MPMPKDPIKYKEAIQNMSIAHKGKHFLNKGQFKKGEKSWNNGLPKENQPMFGKISGMKGKKHSEETKRKMKESNKKISGENHPNYGKRGKDTPMFGKNHSKESNEKNRINHIGKKHKPESILKMSGENNNNWKGGTSFLPYCNKFNNKRKKAVRDFFGGYCIVTGEHQNDCSHKHNVHHIDHDKEQGCNGKPFNLVPMNDAEHARELYYEEEYKKYINKTLREGFKWGIWSQEEYMEKVMYNV